MFLGVITRPCSGMFLGVITGRQWHGPKCYYWTKVAWSWVLLDNITVVRSLVLLLDHSGMVQGVISGPQWHDPGYYLTEVVWSLLLLLDNSVMVLGVITGPQWYGPWCYYWTTVVWS